MVAPPDNDVLWARGLTYAHDGSPALQGVSMGVREGEILAVTGPRGSGKTTLLRCLSGQLRVQRGEVWFNSVPVHTMGPLARERLRRDRFGWIDPEPVLVPELNAWENTALPLMLRGTGRRAAKAAALEWLERLDIRDAARKRPHALLQSERQRVVVARALVAAPTVLFADEPTASLHRAEHTHVLRTLTTAARSHAITVVLATHDPEIATLADRTLPLLDGRHVRTVHLPTPPQGETPTATAGSPTTEATGRRPAREGAGRPVGEHTGRPSAADTPAPTTGTAADTEGRRAAGAQGEHATGAEGERATGGEREDRAGAVGDDRAAVEGEGRAACSLSV
ncbi:ATP-binding cassette domain-containing protein [Streptomyces phaeolivaceus]|uniref:ATP-binding cassette domain-containing protein n=1 Tax=Streptomyces phaeolivaceus TaxID=2653200 RepID=A0A5P8KCT6_9ACTN|nr:ATP-binding cassette domain-containing protein [Streptomyces phaeolivaceus]